MASSMTADVIFSAWLQRFSDAMNDRDAGNIAQFFEPEGYWKDILAFTWEHRCFFQRDDIAKAMQATLNTADPSNFRAALGRTPPRRIKRASRGGD